MKFHLYLAEKQKTNKDLDSSPSSQPPKKLPTTFKFPEYSKSRSKSSTKLTISRFIRRTSTSNCNNKPGGKTSDDEHIK